MPYLPESNNKKQITERKRAFSKQYDEQRGNSHERGYDSAWRRTRLYHLTNNPFCYDCLQRHIFIVASDVHHIKKLSDHPELKHEPTNLRSLCRKCHNDNYTSKGL